MPKQPTTHVTGKQLRTFFEWLDSIGGSYLDDGRERVFAPSKTHRSLDRLHDMALARGDSSKYFLGNLGTVTGLPDRFLVDVKMSQAYWTFEQERREADPRRASRMYTRGYACAFVRLAATRDGVLTVLDDAAADQLIERLAVATGIPLHELTKDLADAYLDDDGTMIDWSGS